MSEIQYKYKREWCYSSSDVVQKRIKKWERYGWELWNSCSAPNSYTHEILFFRKPVKSSQKA